MPSDYEIINRNIKYANNNNSNSNNSNNSNSKNSKIEQ